jgi:hypothetical protein
MVWIDCGSATDSASVSASVASVSDASASASVFCVGLTAIQAFGRPRYPPFNAPLSPPERHSIFLPWEI